MQFNLLYEIVIIDVLAHFNLKIRSHTKMIKHK